MNRFGAEPNRRGVRLLPLSVTEVTVVAIIVCCMLSPGYAQYHFSPSDMTLNVGDRNIFIPCPFGGPAAVSWMIGNRTYTQSTLPAPYVYVTGGLIIQYVYQNMSGLTFQCFAPSKALDVHESSTGKLSVHPSLTENVQEEYFPAPFEPQPVNFTRESGDQNIFVPCPFGGPAIPSWKIGNHIYTYSTLPNNFIQAASGLIIKSINSNMTGLSFQCFSPSGKGLLVDKSSVGILTVPDHTEKIEDVHDADSEVQDVAAETFFVPGPVILDHQNFLLTEESITIAWRMIGQRCNYFINSTRCESMNSGTIDYYSQVVMDTKVTIDPMKLYDNKNEKLYLDITNGNMNNEVCPESRTALYFSFKKGVVTTTHSVTPYYDKICVKVPDTSNRESVRIILPNRMASSLTEQGVDLICAAQCEKDDMPDPVENCCSLRNKCSPLLERTIFSDSTSLCKKDNTSDIYQLCISNPTVEMNNTKIHFFYESRCTNTKTTQDIGVAEYVKAVEIIITVPPPPTNFSVNLESRKICFSRQPNEQYPADYYKVYVTDVTGYEIFKNEDVPSTMSCVIVNALTLLECAPFNISVVGHNDHGDSRLTYLVAGEGGNESSWRDCANRKVQLSLNSTADTNAVYYSYVCQSVLNGELEPSTMFVIKLQGGDFNKTNNHTSCASGSISRSRSGKFDGLKCSAVYNIAAYFVYPDGNDSDYQVANTYMEIKTKYSKYDLSCQDNYWIVVGPLLLLILVILIASIITCCCCYHYREEICKCCRSREYKPHSNNNK